MADGQDESLTSGVMNVLKNRRKEKQPGDDSASPTLAKPGVMGSFMVDGRLFPSLSGKKVGEVDYLPVKIVKISGGMFEVAPYKDEDLSGGMPGGEGTPQEIPPSQTGQEQGMF